MDYGSRLAPFAVIMLASSVVMMGMMKTARASCNGRDVCSPFEMPPCGDALGCRCIPWGLFIGQCIYPLGDKSLAKRIEEHPNLCQSDEECIKKAGSGGGLNFCARYPNPQIDYGWCINNNTDVSFSNAAAGFW
ncbi:unnamed protein product [Cuscuta epithymum]|uniref:Albumin I chain a domain-containing protein n=1 Tax=Cuscuta epithymum TaxID=186058 RepID=A0AAV0E7A4_9ASTE|nr:unnamed protein product [Cuscuta epithymum]